MDDNEFPFPSPFDTENPQKQKTAGPFRIMFAHQLIREKNGWRENLKNDKMIDSWMEEAIGNGLKVGEFAAVLEQLKYYDSQATESMDVGVVDGTRLSDTLISEQLKNELVETVNDLLDKSHKKDYDPGTDDLVVNLLDPKLYGSVSGVTRITDFDLDIENCLRNIGNGKAKAESRIGCGPVPVVCQLLPAEFHVKETGQVKINSYINNLHPQHDAKLYSLIESIFSCFIPLFNGVLHDLLHDKPTKVRNDQKKQKLDESYTKTYLHGRDIQVIVRMKSIELTTEKAEFDGGDWHIEGEQNEHIVASGVYCFHTENITESRLYFRQLRGQNQEMGSIATPENRLIAFPNICQHRIGPLKLVDKSKPGNRKILVFFLIDPTARILSTRNVPPQQLSWYEDELLKIPPFDRLDEYAVRYITRCLEWPLSMEEAISFRNKLIRSRKEPFPSGPGMFYGGDVRID